MAGLDLCCAVDGCPDRAVTARAVPIDTTLAVTARVLLCDLHGRSRPLWPIRPLLDQEATGG